MRRCLLLAVATLLSCEATPTPLDAEPVDASALDRGAPDGPEQDAATDAALPDAEPDAQPLDQAVPDAALVEPHVVPIALGGRLLPGESAHADVPPIDTPELELWLRAPIWRVEDGHLSLDLGDGPRPVRLAGDARGLAVRLTPREGAFDGVGPGARQRPLRFAPPTEITLTAEGGLIEIQGAWLTTPGAQPPPPPAPPPPNRQPVPVPPCGEPGCDDGVLLSAAVASAPEGAIEVQLSGTYHLQTPFEVRRDDVHLVGPATLVWAPGEARPVAAVDVRGLGPQGEAMPVATEVAAEQSEITVVAPADWAPARVRFEADDFGPIPEACVGGRDVEKYHRHIGRLFRVLERTVGEGTVTLRLDRPVHLAVPAEANPRLRAVSLLGGFSAQGLHVLGDCPEALEYTGSVLAPCANEALNTDDGLALRWTEGARLAGTHVQAIGRFAVGVYDALDTQIVDHRMDHPTSYGSGGRGYGVHLIRATRSLVLDAHVEQARHGVVIDFGSTESQVIGGTFRNMNQATLDVHGESSRDTLIRDTTCADAPTGIIVGGGGHEVHCNDGPRHHLESNHLETAVALWVADETREVYARANAMVDGRTAVTLINGAGPIDLSDGLISGTAGPPFLLGTSGPLRVSRTRFPDHCDPGAVALGAVEWGAENTFCGETQPSP